MSNVLKFPVIAGVDITTDTEGRFNLNALHRASGLKASKAPSQWLRTKQACELQEALCQHQNVNIHSAQSLIDVVNGGVAPGTFAHEILAVEYAGWISPAFRIQVNQTFLDYKSGKLQAPVPALSKLDILEMAMESERGRLQLEHQNTELVHKIEEDAPKVEFHDQVVASEDTFSVREAAKIIGTGQNRLMAWLRRNGWVTKYNEPYQLKIVGGLMDVKLGQFNHPEYGLTTKPTPIVTAKGLARLQEIYAPGVAA